MNRYLLPLIGFLVLSTLLYFGLKNDPKAIPSPFIGKEAPAFELPRLYQASTFQPQSMQGKVWVLNVWASWCASCVAEHEVIKHFSTQERINIVGLNYKDEPNNAKKWLAARGNPYYAIAIDQQGEAGLDWGVYGVPESFVIDKQGIVRYKVVGPMTEDKLNTTLRPLIRQLREEEA